MKRAFLVVFWVLPGGTFSPASAISSAGHVTGMADIATGDSQAFLWTKDSPIAGIGVSGSPLATGTGVNSTEGNDESLRMVQT